MERHLVGGDVPQKLLCARARLRRVVADIDQRGIGEAVDRHIAAAPGFAPAAPVAFIDALGRVEAGEEGRLNIAMGADLRCAAGAGGAHPNGRMRLLNRARPDVDGAMVKEAALMAKEAVVVGPAFDDEVERLPMALVHAHRVAVGREDLVRHAAHESGFEPAMREHIDHGHLLGDAHRLAAVGDRIAENEKPGLLGEPRERSQHERSGGVDAGRGLMMLVEHDLDPFVLRDQPFIDVTVVEGGALDRIVDAVGQRHPYRWIGLGGRQERVRGFAEVPRSHVTLRGSRAPLTQRRRAAPDAARGLRREWSASARRAAGAHRPAGNPRRRDRRSRRG